ncbi:MAG: 50S ribosomal protein L4 [Candidatus Magasanikbacteria bacterium]
MTKVSVYNLDGKESGNIVLSDDIFGIKPKQTLVHEVYIAQEANKRQPWADTKDKSEVSGGGRKPWKQKGTGRARHGSIRSPIWKGGGVTFGPLKSRSYKQKINKKKNRLATMMCLSSKVADEKFIVLESFPVDGKTKTLKGILSLLPGHGKTTLFLSSGQTDTIGLAIRNIPRVNMQRAVDVSVSDLLNHQFVLISKDDIEVLADRFSEKKIVAEEKPKTESKPKEKKEEKPKEKKETSK